MDELTRRDAAVVVVTPAHQFPTGAVLSPARRAALVEWAEREERLIVEDDYDAEFRYDRVAVGALQGLAPERVLYIGSASKRLTPGMRLGWILAPSWLAWQIATAKAVRGRRLGGGRAVGAARLHRARRARPARAPYARALPAPARDPARALAAAPAAGARKRRGRRAVRARGAARRRRRARAAQSRRRTRRGHGGPLPAPLPPPAAPPACCSASATSPSPRSSTACGCSARRMPPARERAVRSPPRDRSPRAAAVPRAMASRYVAPGEAHPTSTPRSPRATAAPPAQRPRQAARARRCDAARVGWRSIPSRPKRSIATEITSWPVITAAVRPVAPSVRTVRIATVT